MTDKKFKALPHTLKRYMQYKNGQKAEDGYSPDFLLKHEDKEHYTIIEFEKNASRKCLLGDIVKAAHFLCGDKAGYMVLVIEAECNSKKAEAVVTHLRFYFHWIKKITHLRKVWVISIDDYMNGEVPLPINSKQFKKIATCL